MYLQSYITPVVVYSESGRGANIEKAFGTSFVVNGLDGGNGNTLSITAAHVLTNAIRFSCSRKWRVGIVGKGGNGGDDSSIAVPILAAERAPNGSDIAIILSNYKPKAFLTLSGDTPDVWTDVATLGYPDEAVVGEPNSLRLNLRAQKGYIQRIMAPGDLLHRPTLFGYELSFLLAGGMSGAPVFLHRGNRDFVIGVSVGTFGSETMISERVDVLEDGSKYAEIHSSLNRYGVAEGVAPLMDWRPDILPSVSLRDYLAGNRDHAQWSPDIDDRLPFVNFEC